MAIFNPRDYGARGDNKRDDTAAIQAAIDDAIGSPGGAAEAADARARTRYAGGTVYLPAGDYKLTRPLRFWGTMYLRFVGDGGSTRLIPVGELESVLDINGTACCEFAQFRIEGNNQDEAVQNAINFYWDGTTGRSTEFCNFHDIAILGTRCVTAFRIGKQGSGMQLDTSTYRNIMLKGSWTPGESKWWQIGFFVGTDVHGNCLVHSFYDPSITHWGEGIHVGATNFSQVGGNFGGNGVDLVGHTLNYFLVQGVRSESSGRFLVAGTGQNHNAANFSISDVLWWPDRLHPDGKFIYSSHNGALYLRNLVVPTGPVLPRIHLAPGDAAYLMLDGVTSNSQLPRFLSGLNDRVDASVRGYTCMRPDGTFQTMERGIVTTGPVVWPGSGSLQSQQGGLYFSSAKGKTTYLVPPER